MDYLSAEKAATFFCEFIVFVALLGLETRDDHFLIVSAPRRNQRKLNSRSLLACSLALGVFRNLVKRSARSLGSRLISRDFIYK